MPNMRSHPDLSIVIPAYNEEARVGPTLRSYLDYCRDTRRSVEVTVVDDGSLDGTSRVVDALAGTYPELRLIRLADNRGKGYAVRTGIVNSRGNQILFADADAATPIVELERLEAAIAAGADVAIGSRAAQASDVTVQARPLRRIMGRTFHRPGRDAHRPRYSRHPVRLQAVPRSRGARALLPDANERIQLRRRSPDDGPAPGLSHRRGAGELDPPAGVQGEPGQRLGPDGLGPVHHSAPLSPGRIQRSAPHALDGISHRNRARFAALTAVPTEPSSESRFERGLTWAAGLVLLLALLAEFRSLIRPDTGFLLDAAGRVLDGAVIYRDVVEINPPLIIWLNMLAVEVSRLSGLSDIVVYRVGFTLLLFGCLGVAMMVVRRFLLPGEARLQRLSLAALAFVLFALPGRDYGEREHLVLGLVLPYVFLAAARAGGTPVPRGWGWLAGGLAGLGFALKPHFLLLWPALECVPRLRRQLPWSRVLPETAAIGLVLTGYLGAIALVTPQYFELVARLAGAYTRFLYDPFWHLLVTGPGAAVTFLALLATVALRQRAGHPALWDGLALATVATYLAGAAQQKGLDYHFYPSLGLAVVLLVLVTADLRSPPVRLAERLYRVVAASAW